MAGVPLLFEGIADLRERLREERARGRSIGFVPTMGYLHAGHLSLVSRAREMDDLVVVSIFVNPTQFGPHEDYSIYPRDLGGDLKKAGEAGADLVFAPSAEEMYPEGATTFVDVGPMGAVMCGASRPAHFRGVTTVVAKLFNIVQPDRAYFGQKDAQQAVIIKRMTADLNFPVEVVILPIVREEDGLALSSRNVYLEGEERTAALVLYKTLTLARDMILEGEKDARVIRRAMEENIAREPLARLDYAVVVDADTLAEKEIIEGRVLMAVAAWVGRCRLIDNFLFESY